MKTAFITGANSGIGKQAAIQLARAGVKVYVGARNKKRGDTAIEEIKQETNSSNVKLVMIDVSSADSIERAAERLKQELLYLDILIHNAADFDITQQEPKLSLDGIETIWATNHIGPILLTQSLLSLLKTSKQGRVMTIASKGLVMHPKLQVDLKDPEFKRRKFSVAKAYYQSKIAQVMYTYWLADHLKDSSITVNCIRVTNVKIDISRYPHISWFMKKLYSVKSLFSITPNQMAKTYTYLALDDSLKNISGKYFDEHNEIVSSSSYSMQKAKIAEVIRLSMDYT